MKSYETFPSRIGRRRLTMIEELFYSFCDLVFHLCHCLLYFTHYSLDFGRMLAGFGFQVLCVFFSNILEGFRYASVFTQGVAIELLHVGTVMAY